MRNVRTHKKNTHPLTYKYLHMCGWEATHTYRAARVEGAVRRPKRNFAVLQEHWQLNSHGKRPWRPCIYLYSMSRASREILLLIDEVFGAYDRSARAYIETPVLVLLVGPRLYSLRVLITNHISDIRVSGFSEFR